MKINLTANSHDYPSSIEISITGNKEAYIQISDEIKQLTSSTIFLFTEKESEFYKNKIDTLNCIIKESTNGLLDLSLEKNSLNISGDKVAFIKLSEILLSFSEFENTSYDINSHFHLDYFEGNEILSETSISLILELEIQN